MTLRCSKQRFFPLKTLSTEEEDSAILHVSSPVTPMTCGKQQNSQRNRPMGRLELNTESVLRSNLVSAGPKTSEYVSRRPWASEFLGCTLTHWLEVDSISTYLVWNSKRLDFIWKTLVSLCVLFHCDSLCFMLGISISDSICLKLHCDNRFFEVLKTRVARSSGSPPYAQKLLQGWVRWCSMSQVPAWDFAWLFFRLFLYISSYICAFLVKR